MNHKGVNVKLGKIWSEQPEASKNPVRDFCQKLKKLKTEMKELNQK